MSENVQLLQEINDQRKECHALRQKIKNNQLQIAEMSMGSTQGGMFGGDVDRELKMQDLQIEELTRQIQDYEQNNEMLRQNRPRVGQLPPIEGDGYQQQYYDDGQAMGEMDGMDPEMEMEQPAEIMQPEMEVAMEPPAEEQQQPPAEE